MDTDGVHLTCNFFAPPEAVFDAWINKDFIRKWLFVGSTSEIVHVEMDVRVQGKFSILEQDNIKLEHIDHFGEYVSIERPGRLEFTLSVPKHFAGKTTVEIIILATDAGSELTLTQTGVSRIVTEGNWKKMLFQLQLALENQ